MMYRCKQCPVTMNVAQWAQHPGLCHTCFTYKGIRERRAEEDAAVAEAVAIVSEGVPS